MFEILCPVFIPPSRSCFIGFSSCLQHAQKYREEPARCPVNGGGP